MQPREQAERETEGERKGGREAECERDRQRDMHFIKLCSYKLKLK